jgi:hypothetical protein
MSQDAKALYGYDQHTKEENQRGSDQHDPHVEMADAVYRGASRLHPAERVALADHHDILANTLNFGRSAREQLVHEPAEALASAGIGVYDRKLYPILVDGIVRAKVAELRGTEMDAAAEDARYEETIRELRSVYGDDDAEDLLVRTSRWLERHPRLNATIKRARASNDPRVVRALAEHVRAENLGRA